MNRKMKREDIEGAENDGMQVRVGTICRETESQGRSGYSKTSQTNDFLVNYYLLSLI